MTQPEHLAMELITKPMTKAEICVVLGSKEKPANPEYAAKVINKMRHSVLPDLGAWCPRPTHESGYIYRVLDKEPNGDNLKLTRKGAEMMKRDNERRLRTMLETAEPYAATLDKRTKQGKAAHIIVKAATLALDSLAMIEQ